MSYLGLGTHVTIFSTLTRFEFLIANCYKKNLLLPSMKVILNCIYKHKYLEGNLITCPFSKVVIVSSLEPTDFSHCKSGWLS